MKLEESDVLARLAVRYSAAKGWAFFSHLRNHRGHKGLGRTRTIDGLAVGLWPSQGHEVHGFEVKCSRGDFQRELKDPSKAEAFTQFCDKWWLVVGDSKIVSKDEVPKGWGLIVPRGNSLAVSVQAARLKPLPMTKEFMVALLGASALGKEQREAELVRETFAAFEETVASGSYANNKVHEARVRANSAERRAEIAESRIDSLTSQVDEVRAAFEEITEGGGITAKEITRAIDLAKRLRSWKDGTTAIREAKLYAERIVPALHQVLLALEGTGP